MRLLKHRNNTDVAIEILKSFYVKEKHLYKLKVRWWRVSKVNPPRSMGFEQKIEIPKDKMSEWEIYETTLG